MIEKHDKKTQNTNLYVKDFPIAWTDKELRDTFSPYGELGSVVIMKDEKGSSKGFGFVDFKEFDSATKALELHQKVVEGQALYVVRHQKKGDRSR